MSSHLGLSSQRVGPFAFDVGIYSNLFNNSQVVVVHRKCLSTNDRA